MVVTFLQNALNLCIFIHAPVPHSKLQAGFLKICFSQDERGEENYDLLQQNSIREFEDDLEHYVIYILYDLLFF